MKFMDFFELSLGRVTIKPNTAAKIKLINETEIVVNKPPIKNSIFEEPFAWKGLIENHAKL